MDIVRGSGADGHLSSMQPNGMLPEATVPAAESAFVTPESGQDGYGATAAMEPLSDFILQLDEVPSAIPDVISAHYMKAAGFNSPDPRVARLISLATQRFISDIANDAMQYTKSKASGQTNKKQAKDKPKLILTMEDLMPALSEYGVTVRKPPYFP